MQPAAVIAALACCLVSTANSQATLCKDHKCSATFPSYLVVPKTKDNLNIEETVATLAATDCEKEEWKNSTGSIYWEDCACNCSGPVRVALVALVAVMVFYAVVVFLFVTGIKILRSGPRAEYADLKAAGKVKEDTEEIGGESDSAWISKSEDQIRTEVRHSFAAVASASSTNVRILSATLILAAFYGAQCGLDAAVYLLHCRQCAMFWLAQFFTMGVILCLTYGVFGEYDDKAHILTLSFANLANDNNAKWVIVLSQYWFVGCTVAFTMWKQKGMDAYKLEAEEEGGRHTSLNTVWISGITVGTAEDKLASWFESEYEGAVLEAKMVWDVNALGHNIRGRRRLIMKINALTQQIADSPDEGTAGKLRLKVEGLTQQVKTLEQWEPDLRARKLTSAGHAFVTFKSESATQSFRQGLAAKAAGAQSKDAAALGVAKWSAVMAPRSAEIYWENFGLDAKQKKQNWFKAFGFTIMMFVIFVLAALGAFWVLGFVYMWLLYNVYPLDNIGDTHDSMVDAVSPVVFYGCFGLFFAVLFLGLEEEMSPIVKFICKFESPYTKSHKQSSYLAKMYWFYIIFHVGLSTVLLGVLALWCDVRNIPVVEGGCEDTGGDTDADGLKCRSGRLQLYVESVGVFHQHRLFLTVCVVDFIHVLEGLSFFTRKAHTLDDKELAEFTSAEDEEDEEELLVDEADKFFSDKYDYTRNYAESIAVFSSIATYATMHPTMMLLGSVYFSIKYYVDKYQITNQYSKPHVQYGRRARTTTIYILWAQTIGQWLNALYFLVLSGDYALGVALLVSALVMSMLTFFYVYQPDQLKLNKTSSRAANKIERLESADPSQAQAPLCGVYMPPRPEDLAVNLAITESSAPVKVDNPMTDGEADGDADEDE